MEFVHHLLVLYKKNSQIVFSSRQVKLRKDIYIYNPGINLIRTEFHLRLNKSTKYERYSLHTTQLREDLSWGKPLRREPIK